MSKHLTIIILVMVISVASFSLYVQQDNHSSLRKLTSELNSIQVQVNRGFNQEIPELTDEQRRILEAAYKKVWDARRELIEAEQQVGLITQEEAQYLKDHLDLMTKYGHDYEPPLWGGHMRMGRHRMGHR